MGFTEKIINILIKPKKAFESIIKEPYIEEAVMIVGLYALFSAAAAYIQSTKIIMITEGKSPFSPEFAQTIVIISAIIIAFLTWLILAGIIHTISLAMGGKGAFYPQMIVSTGFALLPLIFANIISAGLISTAEATTVAISLTDVSSTQKAVADIQGTTPFLASTIVTWLAWIWTMFIIFTGLQTGQKSSKEKAMVAVGIPFVLMLIITYGFR